MLINGYMIINIIYIVSITILWCTIWTYSKLFYQHFNIQMFTNKYISISFVYVSVKYYF